MKISLAWKEKMQFVGSSDGNPVTLDAKAPLGDGAGPTPKELLVMAVSGCTAMDVIALMKKHKQPVETFEVAADVSPKEGSQPAVFSAIDLQFKLTGALDRERVIEAVRLSQTKYCGVSAMLAHAFPIRYRVILNGEEIAAGEADFQNA